MLVTWHIIEKEKYTEAVFTLTKRCCDDFNKLEYYINWQPTGLRLEIPVSLDIDFLDEENAHVEWKKIGKIDYCPFCGEKIKFIEEIIKGPKWKNSNDDLND